MHMGLAPDCALLGMSACDRSTPIEPPDGCPQSIVSLPCLSFFHEVVRLRRLPPLNALKAFEAAARHESFTRAAEELFVTQGAVSHQVKALEEELGVKLFNRERQRLVITEAGRQYLTILRDAFDRIALGTERLLQRQSSGALTVSTSPDFAAKWLVNRLGRFAEEHASIDLRVSATLHHVDFAREDVDLAVRHGDGNWPGLNVVRLSAEQLFPVCSPKLLGGRNRLTKPADVLKLPLIHVDDRKDWTRWLEAAGVTGIELSHGPVQSREHGHRRGSRRPRYRACTHHACGNGSYFRAIAAPVCRGAAAVQDLLDHLSKGDGSASEDRDLSGLAAERGRQ
jgi:LysR family transcriptional regulator, glycine cleavage system transcriptional activator